MFEKVAEAKFEPSNRRRFLRKIAGLTVVSALVALIHSKSEIDQAFAANGSGLIIGEANSGSSVTSLTASIWSGITFQATNSATFGSALYGLADSTTGITWGIFGNNYSVSGTGVVGSAGASTGTTYGVWGESNSVEGIGVYGIAHADTGYTYGVYGEVESTNGRGVVGFANSSTGINYGVYGTSDSPNGISVMGLAGNAGTKPIIARGRSGHTASLQEWQDSGGTALSVIYKSGYLGIGTNSPVTAFHVQSSSSNPAIRIENENNHVGEFIYCYSDSHIPFFSGRRARGTTATPSAVQPNDVLMRYGGSGYGGGGLGFPAGNRAILEFRAAETWTGSAQGTYITFLTTPTGSNIAAERILITAAGEIIPPNDNTGSIGTASKRWSLVRATTVTSGDLVFENGVRATEEGKGIAFKNDAGEKIAVLDREGNLRVKGKLIEGL